MTEQLPIINTSHNVTATKGESSNLLGRGLAAIQRKETGVVLADLDSRYRQARDIYNRITDYGEETRFKVELLPTQEELLKEPLLQQLQPFYNQIKQLAEIFTVFQELANQGYGKAYFPLCLMYKGGQGASQNIEKSEYYGKLAFTWCFENQTLNEPEIWTDLGRLYDRVCDTVLLEESEPYCYFIKRTQISAPMRLWEWYENEWMQEDDEYRSIGFSMILYRKAADRGYPRAQYILGDWFAYEAYGEQDYEIAVLWYREAAEHGYAKAQYSLGEMYRSEQGGVNYDEEQALFWKRKAAEQGDANAQFNLGEMYSDGQDGVVQDYKQSLFWFRKAAEQSHADAQRLLGFMYDFGHGVDQDYKQAVFWYRKAAEQGDATSQSNLAGMYALGVGVEHNDEQTAFWFHKAAEQGHRDSQFHLGVMYEYGHGVKQNNEQALFWYIKSARQWNKEAQEKLKQLGINWQES